MGIPSAVNLAAAFMAGISEEAVCRGMSASYLMRQWKDKNRILSVIFVSSAIFALIHAFNVFAGAPLGMTGIQIVNAFSIGCFFCALFIRSGSLIPSMVFHTLNDIIAFTDVSSIGEGGAYNSTASISVSDTVIVIILDLIYLGITLFLVRPSVRNQVRELWDKKWRCRDH
jgi:membrane protease YdiL (CAAX protease family)